MPLEDFFDLLAPTDIRLKGTRVGWETILWDYLDGGLGAEQIVLRYPTLSLAQVTTALVSYWQYQPEAEAYLNLVEQELVRQRQAQALNPPPILQRLRELKTQLAQPMEALSP